MGKFERVGGASILVVSVAIILVVIKVVVIVAILLHSGCEV